MQTVCRVEDINPESGKEINIEGVGSDIWLVLFIRDGRVLAYHNQCPHQGREMNWAPDRFMVSKEGQLVCPHHGACFDLESGLCTAGPCKGEYLKPVKARLVDGDVQVGFRKSG